MRWRWPLVSVKYIGQLSAATSSVLSSSPTPSSKNWRRTFCRPIMARPQSSPLLLDIFGRASLCHILTSSHKCYLPGFVVQFNVFYNGSNVILSLFLRWNFISNQEIWWRLIVFVVDLIPWLFFRRLETEKESDQLYLNFHKEMLKNVKQNKKSYGQIFFSQKLCSDENLSDTKPPLPGCGQYWCMMAKPLSSISYLQKNNDDDDLE